MKKIILMLAVICSAALVSCNKKADQPQEEKYSISLEITAIQNNCATINVSLTEGQFYGAKIVEMVNHEDLTFDPTKDIQLVKYVEDNGAEITLPYTKTIEKIRIGKDRFTAVIVYDSKGRAAKTAYKVWTPEGSPAGWSTENNPGELDEIEW